MPRFLLITLSLFLLALPAQAQPKASPAEIERLIRQLGSDSFAEREAASKALQDIGQPALGPLRKALSGNGDKESLAFRPQR